MPIADHTTDLYASLAETGVYPDVATGQLRRFLRGEPVLGFIVLPDVVVDVRVGAQMELHVLALTSTRVIAWVGYELAGELGEATTLQTHARTYPLTKVAAVDVSTGISSAGAGQEPVTEFVRVVVVLDALDQMALRTGYMAPSEDGSAGEHEHETVGEVMHERIVVRETREGAGAAKLESILDFAALLAERVADR